jgi:hypothetical protein
MDIIREFTFDTKLNQNRHEFEIYFDNGAGESDNRRYPINPNAIVNLTIHDTLADWVARGHMTFYYNPESNVGTYDNRLGNVNTGTGLLTPEQKGFYVFRNDGYDYLRIRIKPNLQDQANINSTGTGTGITITDEKHWTLSYLFSIFDVEDIDLPPGARNQASSTVKCLKVYFWDSWYQKMITNYMQYSTALSPLANIEEDKLLGVYANPGVLPTGIAMKEFIDLSLCSNPSQANYTGDVTGLTDTSLNLAYTPTAPLGENWEEGAAKLFYTNPTQTNCYEGLKYIHDRHISNNSINIQSNAQSTRDGVPADNAIHDFSILKKDRGPIATDVGQLTLKSMASFFAKAGKTADAPGEYQIEHFFLQSYDSFNASKVKDVDVTPTSRATKSYRAPISNSSSDTVDLKSLKYNQITNYRFVDISALTNTTQFCTSPVHSFDFKNRTFNVEFKNNTVLAAREFMSQKYINELYKKSVSDTEKLFLITLDQDKKNKNLRSHFSCYGDDPLARQADGIQKLLYIGVFQNACINFRALGLTCREPGRFIAIDKTDGVEPGVFEDKFFGQWFVIDVKHVFETEFYYNDITAIKIHRFDTLPLNFVGTIDNQ